MTADRIVCIPRETDAVARGLELLGEEDLLFILADKVPQTLALVRERLADERAP
jgi:hypothetical protein